MDSQDERFERELQRASIIYALTEGTTRSAACRAAGVGRGTLYEWLERDETFRARVGAAEAKAVDNMESLAYACAEKAIEDPRYLRALFFWLKCRAGWAEAKPDLFHAAPRSGDGYPRPSLGRRLPPPRPPRQFCPRPGARRGMARHALHSRHAARPRSPAGTCAVARSGPACPRSVRPGLAHRRWRRPTKRARPTPHRRRDRSLRPPAPIRRRTRPLCAICAIGDIQPE